MVFFKISWNFLAYITFWSHILKTVHFHEIKQSLGNTPWVLRMHMPPFNFVKCLSLRKWQLAKCPQHRRNHSTILDFPFNPKLKNLQPVKPTVSELFALLFMSTWMLLMKKSYWLIKTSDPLVRLIRSPVGSNSAPGRVIVRCTFLVPNHEEIYTSIKEDIKILQNRR